MNSSEWYRRTPGLLAGVVLLLSCFLLSGCKLTHLLGPFLLDDIFGDLRDQFPTVVLFSRPASPNSRVHVRLERNDDRGS